VPGLHATQLHATRLALRHSSATHDTHPAPHLNALDG